MNVRLVRHGPAHVACSFEKALTPRLCTIPGSLFWKLMVTSEPLRTRIRLVSKPPAAELGGAATMSETSPGSSRGGARVGVGMAVVAVAGG